MARSSPALICSHCNYDGGPPPSTRQLPFGHRPSAWRFHGMAGGPIGRPPVLPESSSYGGSMARGRAVALDPWRDGRAAGGPVAMVRWEVAARRRYGASGGRGSTRTEASLWVGWLGTEEQIAGLERAEAQNIRRPTRASTPASRRMNKCRLTHEQVPLYRSTSRVPVPCYGKLQFTPNDK